MINKATLGKEVDGVIEYIYPKTSADMVEYTAEMTVEQKIKSIDTDITATNSRISSIVAQAGTDNTEIVDARTPVFTPADSSILDSNGACATLKDRLSADFSSLSNEIREEIKSYNEKWEAGTVEIKNDMNNSISELNSDINELKGDLVITPSYEFVDGYCVNGNDGSLITINSYSYVTIEVYQGMKIKGYTRAMGIYYSIAFYDSNDKFISSVYNTNTISYDFNFEVVAPDNAVKCKITCSSSYKNSFKVEIHSTVANLLKVNGSIIDLPTIRKVIENLSVNINDLVVSFSYYKETDYIKYTGLVSTGSKTPTITTNYGGIYTEISVSEGEKYSIYGYRRNNSYGVYVFVDNNGNKVNNDTGSETGWQEFTDISVPDGATKLYVNGYVEHEPFPIIKKYVIEDMDSINNMLDSAEKTLSDLSTENVISKYENKQWLLSLYEQDCKNPFSWKPFDKAYFSWSNDDARGDMYLYKDLCDTYNIPYSNSVPWEVIKANTVQVNGVSVVDYCKQIVEDGGEIFTHALEPLTSQSTDEEILEYFRDGKKIIEDSIGCNVYGIVQAGGSGYSTFDYNKGQMYCLGYYQFSDFYGITPQYKLPRVRIMLSEYDDETAQLNAFKSVIDDAVTNHKWVRFYCHGTDEVSISLLTQVFEYVKTYVDNGTAEWTTWKNMYDKFRSSKLEQLIS